MENNVRFIRQFLGKFNVSRITDGITIGASTLRFPNEKLIENYMKLKMCTC